MAWERRGHGTYYYRAHKSAGRVVKEYVGGGLIGELAARQDETRRRQHHEARAALQAEQAACDAAAAAHMALSRAADALMRSALVGAGYHRHDRGQWRKRRVRRAH